MEQAEKIKTPCPFVNGKEGDCLDADTERCEYCTYNKKNRRSYFKEFVGEIE